MISHTSDLAEKVSSKVRLLDLVKVQYLYVNYNVYMKYKSVDSPYNKVSLGSKQILIQTHRRKLLLSLTIVRSYNLIHLQNRVQDTIKQVDDILDLKVCFC